MSWQKTQIHQLRDRKSLRFRIVLCYVVERELHPFDRRLGVVGERADALIVVEFADRTVIGAQLLHGFSDGDFLLTFVITNTFRIRFHEAAHDVGPGFKQIIARDDGDLLVLDILFDEVQQQVEAAFLRDVHQTEGENGSVDAARLERREARRGAADLSDADIGFRIQAELRQS